MFRPHFITRFSYLCCRKTLSWFSFAILMSCDQGGEQAYYPAVDKNKQIDKAPIYIFSVHPSYNPNRSHEIFGPMVDYLSDHIDNANFQLEASRNYADYDEKLYAREPHFSLPNPFQTINSLKHGYRVFGKMGDDENFKGIFLVRKDGPIQTVADLKGKVVSYPAPTALAATMLPQYYLQTHGLNVMTDVDNRYVGSQESSIMNVYHGDVAAAAVWPPPWLALIKRRPEVAEALEVKWQTRTLPNNGLVARNDVPDELVKQVGSLLFDLHNHEAGRAILKTMELSKFEPASSDTYQPVADFIALFKKTVRPVE